MKRAQLKSESGAQEAALADLFVARASEARGGAWQTQLDQMIAHILTQQSTLVFEVQEYDRVIKLLSLALVFTPGSTKLVLHYI